MIEGLNSRLTATEGTITDLKVKVKTTEDEISASNEKIQENSDKIGQNGDKIEANMMSIASISPDGIEDLE